MHKIKYIAAVNQYEDSLNQMHLMGPLLPSENNIEEDEAGEYDEDEDIGKSFRGILKGCQRNQNKQRRLSSQH
jgi:hypothetical protein